MIEDSDDEEDLRAIPVKTENIDEEEIKKELKDFEKSKEADLIPTEGRELRLVVLMSSAGDSSAAVASSESALD